MLANLDLSKPFHFFCAVLLFLWLTRCANRTAYLDGAGTACPGHHIVLTSVLSCTSNCRCLPGLGVPVGHGLLSQPYPSMFVHITLSSSASMLDSSRWTLLGGTVCPFSSGQNQFYFLAFSPTHPFMLSSILPKLVVSPGWASFSRSSQWMFSETRWGQWDIS